MRIIGNLCRTFEYTPTTKGLIAVDLAATAIGQRKPFCDCLLLTVMVTPGDSAVPGKAVRLVRRIAAATNAGQFVVNGFVLSPGSDQISCTHDDLGLLTEIIDGLDVLTEFVQRLEECGERVHLMPFGWNTTCHIDAPGHQGRQWLLCLSADRVDTAIIDLEEAAISTHRQARRPLLRRAAVCTRSM